MSKPAILVLTSTYPRHAGDTVPAFVHQLSRELLDSFEVHVLAPHARGAAFSESLEGVQVHRFPYALPALELLAYHGGILENLRQYPWRYLLLPGFLLMQWLWTLGLVLRLRIRLIHAHWVIPQGLVACLAAGMPGFRHVPVLVTGHGSDLFSLKGGVLARVKRWVLRRAAATTVVSGALRQHLAEQGISRGLVKVMPMGVDLQHAFVPGAVAPSTDIVFVGRLLAQKGLDVALGALQILAARGYHPHFHVVGDGPARAGWQSLADGYGLAGQVEWVGAVPPAVVPGWLQRARIALVPSREYEGLGLVAVEAQGCGCAVIASDLPAIRDVVAHGETGVLVAPGDPAALADALQGLLDDPARCQALAAAGRERARERFDWSRVGAGYAQLIRDLLQQG